SREHYARPPSPAHDVVEDLAPTGYSLSMCNHYRQAILKGAVIPGWSKDQFSEIRIPLRFHNMAPDVYPDREGLVVRAGGGLAPAGAFAPRFDPPDQIAPAAPSLT